LRVYRRSATVTSRRNRSWRFSQREQVRAYRVQLCIILVKQPAGAKCERYVPCLNTRDVARRLEWAKQHLDYTWTGTENLRYPNVLNKKVGWVDIDEKWWDMLKKRLMKVHPGQQEQTRVATKSKRFVQKVMGLCAVARPCGDFNGRLGMYRCARKKVAERNSKYHERGDVYDEDCEVDGDMFYEIVTKQLIPDIYDKMADFDVVFVQMDNARPHVKRIADLERIGKKRKRIKGKQMPLMKFVLQPANSPDTNLNDLCFFRSLSKLVQEHEREIEHSAANRDKFWNLIVEQYHEFHSRETLERCWDVKTAVNKCILDAKGTNNYKLPHGIKHEEPVSHDISLDLDDRYRRSGGANFGLRRSACLTPFFSPTINLCCTSCDPPDLP